MSKSIPPTGEPGSTTATATTNPAYATEYYGTPTWAHALSIAVSVLGPIGLMLPPRRMGVRSLVLVTGTCIGTSQLAYDYTGTSLFARFGSRAQGVLDESNADLPPAALKRQAAMRAEKERRALAAKASEALHNQTQPASDEEKSRLQKLWMGKEGENWVEERARRERETLESGGSYWDLIMTQIGEVVEEFLPKPKEDKPLGKEDEKKK